MKTKQQDDGINLNGPLVETACPLCNDQFSLVISVGRLFSCYKCKGFVECIKCGSTKGLLYVHDYPNSYFYCFDCESEFGWNPKDGTSAYAHPPTEPSNGMRCPICRGWFSFVDGMGNETDGQSKTGRWSGSLHWRCLNKCGPDKKPCQVIAIPNNFLLKSIYYSLQNGRRPLELYQEFKQMGKRKRRPKPTPDRQPMNKIVPIEEYLLFKEYEKKNKVEWEEFRRFKDMSDNLKACGSELAEAFGVFKSAVEDGRAADCEDEFEVLQKQVMDLDGILSEIFLCHGHRWDNESDSELFRQPDEKEQWLDGDDDNTAYTVSKPKERRTQYSEVDIEDVPGEIFDAVKLHNPWPPRKARACPRCEEPMVYDDESRSDHCVACRFTTFANNTTTPFTKPATSCGTQDCDLTDATAELAAYDAKIAKNRIANSSNTYIRDLISAVNGHLNKQTNSAINCQEVAYLVSKGHLTEDQMRDYIEVMGIKSMSKHDKRHLKKSHISPGLIDMISHHILGEDDEFMFGNNVPVASGVIDTEEGD